MSKVNLGAGAPKKRRRGAQTNRMAPKSHKGPLEDLFGISADPVVAYRGGGMVKKTGVRKMRGGGMVKKTGVRKMRGGGMVKKTGVRKRSK